MRLSELFRGVVRERTIGNLNVDISNVCSSSQDVAEGSLFVAIRGLRTDGHDYIDEAVANGAAAVVLDREEEYAKRASTAGPKTPALVLVADCRRALGLLASNFWGNPSQRVRLVGLVGTNGKTSISYLLESILSRKASVGVIGTISYRYADAEEEARLTTPDAPSLQRLLARMAGDGVQIVVLETTSHGLVQGRVEGCRFALGVFTNITPEHLDFHGTFNKYLLAKLSFFERHLNRSDGGSAKAIINVDDEHSGRFLAACKVETITFSASGRDADFWASDVRLSAEGTEFTAHTPGGAYRIRSALIGRHSVENCLAATAAATLLGATGDDVVEGIAALRGVPGRFEKVQCGQPFLVVVDFAHTPDAMAKALETARELSGGKIISVFGAGGDRDKSKRGPMGRIAAAKSDLCIITSDNPRSEDPIGIIEQIQQGARSVDGASVLVEPDRRKAIELGIKSASAGDIVLIMGKGHERVQIIGKTRVAFDDREVAAEVMSQMGICK